MSDNMKHRRLQELDLSDFEIGKEEPDIRGWDVRNGAGAKIGEVEELIVDAQQKKVRYMIVDIDTKELKLSARKVLIPIGLAELDKEEDDVLLPSVTVDQLSALPDYDKDNLDDEAEQEICRVLGRTGERNTAASSGAAMGNERKIEERREEQERTSDRHERAAAARDSDEDQPPLGTAEYYGNFYQHAYFNDYNLYKNRQEEKGPGGGNRDSDYDRGLRLWELRAEGGIIASDAAGPEKREREEGNDAVRKERIRHRREQYEERRSKKKGSIIQRINDEGLQEG